MKWIVNGLLHPEQPAALSPHLHGCLFDLFQSQMGLQINIPSDAKCFEAGKEWSSWSDCGTPNDQSTRGRLDLSQILFFFIRFRGL